MLPATHRRFQPLAAALALGMALASVAGCGQLPDQTAGGDKDALPIDPADPCKDQRAEFAKPHSWFTDQITSGALFTTIGGVFSGAAAGATAASNSTDANASPWKAIGATAKGMMHGASLGYYQARAENAKDKDELARDINSDLTKEGQQIDHTTAAFARLRECRFTEATRIKNQARAGHLDRTTALAQIDYERQRFDEELAVAHDYGVNMSKRNDQFVDVSKELKQDRPPKTAARSDPTSQVALAATGTIPEKRRSYDKSIDHADTTSKVAFDLDSHAKLTRLLDTDGDA